MIWTTVWSNCVLLQPRISKLQGWVWDAVNIEPERRGCLLSMTRQGSFMHQREEALMLLQLCLICPWGRIMIPIETWGIVYCDLLALCS